ncbi:MAG: DUF1028 domain-containing protein [Alphaproteobacteria bacterium]|nr:MAG: DUF1028 domain-containing protein [Alphaproteobacteria bacterium]
MTWSVVARCRETGRLGVAVATRFFAVGALCPAGDGGVAAVASQALINPHYGEQALARVRDGVHPAAVVSALVQADGGHAQRQLHMIDSHGRIGQHTGVECVDWAGHLAESDVSVAGNMLVGPQVVADTLTAFLQSRGKPLAERLLMAMEAGEAAGGDKRGRQSACLKVWHTERWAELDIRVDDHTAPLQELRRLYAVSHQHWAVFRSHLATRANPHGTLDRGRILADVEAHQRSLGLAS